MEKLTFAPEANPKTFELSKVDFDSLELGPDAGTLPVLAGGFRLVTFARCWDVARF